MYKSILFILLSFLYVGLAEAQLIDLTLYPTGTGGAEVNCEYRCFSEANESFVDIIIRCNANYFKQLGMVSFSDEAEVFDEYLYEAGFLNYEHLSSLHQSKDRRYLLVMTTKSNQYVLNLFDRSLPQIEKKSLAFNGAFIVKQFKQFGEAFYGIIADGAYFTSSVSNFYVVRYLPKTHTADTVLTFSEAALGGDFIHSFHMEHDTTMVVTFGYRKALKFTPKNTMGVSLNYNIDSLPAFPYNGFYSIDSASRSGFVLEKAVDFQPNWSVYVEVPLFSPVFTRRLEKTLETEQGTLLLFFNEKSQGNQNFFLLEVDTVGNVLNKSTIPVDNQPNHFYHDLDLIRLKDSYLFAGSFQRTASGLLVFEKMFFFKTDTNFIPQQAFTLLPNAINVFPNPAKDYTYIATQLLNETEFTLFNNIGEMVSKQNVDVPSKFKLSLQNLSSGIYVYTLRYAENGRLIGTGKLIIE